MDYDDFTFPTDETDPNSVSGGGTAPTFGVDVSETAGVALKHLNEAGVVIGQGTQKAAQYTSTKLLEFGQEYRERSPGVATDIKNTVGGWARSIDASKPTDTSGTGNYLLERGASALSATLDFGADNVEGANAAVISRADKIAGAKGLAVETFAVTAASILGGLALGPLGAALAGGLTSAAFSAYNEYQETGNVSLGNTLLSGAIGAATSFLGFGIAGRLCGKAIGGGLRALLGKTIVGSLIGGLFGGTKDFANEYQKTMKEKGSVSADDLNNCFSHALDIGAGNGAVCGAFAGFAIAPFAGFTRGAFGLGRWATGALWANKVPIALTAAATYGAVQYGPGIVQSIRAEGKPAM